MWRHHISHSQGLWLHIKHSAGLNKLVLSPDTDVYVYHIGLLLVALPDKNHAHHHHPHAPLHPWQWPNQPRNCLQDHTWARCFSSLWMHIPNGWILTLCHRSHSPRPSKYFGLFSLHMVGPQKVVTDNGMSLTSHARIPRVHVSKWHKVHLNLIYYYLIYVFSLSPRSTNRLAERSGQTLKIGIKCTKGGSLQEKINYQSSSLSIALLHIRQLV